MEIQELQLDKIKPYSKNAKTHPEEQVQLIANSIKEFGFRTPIVVDENFVIIQGHGRRLASLSLGLNTVPCIIADELSKEQVKMLRLADNKVAESEWDEDILDFELSDLMETFTVEDFGFNLYSEEDEEEKYTTKIEIPIYEPKGIKPKIKDLYDDTKYRSLIERIKASSVTEEKKEFLELAARRHIVLNFDLIAEYYSHEESDTKELMEQSALVIIDFDKAIEEGYVKLSKAMQDSFRKDYE